MSHSAYISSHSATHTRNMSHSVTMTWRNSTHDATTSRAARQGAAQRSGRPDVGGAGMQRRRRRRRGGAATMAAAASAPKQQHRGACVRPGLPLQHWPTTLLACLLPHPKHPGQWDPLDSILSWIKMLAMGSRIMPTSLRMAKATCACVRACWY